jgi:hypothetical protein
LHEDEPTITNGQSEHDQYLQSAEELPVYDALVRHVLVDEGQTRAEEAHEISPYERPLYLRIVYVTRPQYHDALREDQGAEEAGEYPTHSPFPVAFHAEEQLRRSRFQVADSADGEGGDGMNEEESVQSLSGEEMIGKGRRGPSGVVAGGVVIHDRCVRRGDWMGAGARPTGSNVVGY